MTTPEGNLWGRRYGAHRTGGRAKSDEEGSETLPLLHGALICVYNDVVRRKSQYTTLKWNFLHRADYPAGSFCTCSAEVPLSGNEPDSCSNLVSC